jgi:hypothetical protein
LSALWRNVLVVLAFLSCSGVRLSGQQTLPYTTVPVQVSARGDVPTLWRVWRAELRENLAATWGYLQVENLQKQTIEDVVFYGEYFDSAGRFCFSMIFSLRHNVGGRQPATRGELRELYSVADGLYPASAPKEVRIYLVRECLGGPAHTCRRWNVPLRSPVTTEGGIPADLDELQLGRELDLATKPLFDLVLAELTVNGEGLVENVAVLNAVDSEIESWFLKFLSCLTFYPATQNGVPQTGECLVLVRAIVSTAELSTLPFVPPDSPWIRARMKESSVASQVPPVTEILFEPAPRKIKRPGEVRWTELPPTPPGSFRLLLLGGDWCPGDFRWVSDATAPRGHRRELAP